MKALLIFISLLVICITLPLQIVQTFLLYQHVHATELMWFLFWFNTPFIILASIVGALAKEIAKK